MKQKAKYKSLTTYEGWLAEEHRHFQTMSSETHVPTDITYRYEVGEPVEYGNLKDCKVEEVLDGGLKLHISFHDKGEHYGIPYDSGRKPRIIKKSDILWLFLSINRGGVPQTEEHIAAAKKLYQEALEDEKNVQTKS